MKETAVSHVIEKEVLVVVKTYPTPSGKHIETVCTAGISKSGEWTRLYPVKFRYLSDDKRYTLFTWIRVRLIKNKIDQRPESYKIFDENIEVLRHLDSTKGLEERKRWLLPLMRKSMEEIEQEYKSDSRSLAIFKPKQIVKFHVDPEARDWTDAEKAKLGQISLFDDPSTLPTVLKKVPYSFRCEYICDDPNCKGHKQKITSWDFNWAYFQYCTRYGDESVALKHLEAKWLSYFSPEKDGYLIVGTTHPYDSFIIIGVFSVAKGNSCFMEPLTFE